jgi:hypothetical protein
VDAEPLEVAIISGLTPVVAEVELDESAGESPNAFSCTRIRFKTTAACWVTEVEAATKTSSRTAV